MGWMRGKVRRMGWCWGGGGRRITKGNGAGVEVVGGEVAQRAVRRRGADVV